MGDSIRWPIASWESRLNAAASPVQCLCEAWPSEREYPGAVEWSWSWIESSCASSIELCGLVAACRVRECLARTSHLLARRPTKSITGMKGGDVACSHNDGVRQSSEKAVVALTERTHNFSRKNTDIHEEVQHPSYVEYIYTEVRRNEHTHSTSTWGH